MAVIMGRLAGGNIERRSIMAKEKQESTQISWRMDGSRVIATIPVSNEQVEFDTKDLHESWILFGKGYFVQQHAASFLAKYSFKVDKTLKKRLADAIDAEDEKAETEVREEIRKAKLAWLKVNNTEIRTALFNQMKVYKLEMTEKAKADRESKAQVEARVKADLIAKTRAQLEAAGMPEDFIVGIISNL
jgi:hypothetical protein